MGTLRAMAAVGLIVLSAAAASAQSKPNVNVRRKPEATPWVKGITPDRVRAGAKTDMRIEMENYNPVKVVGHGSCSKLINTKISPGVVTFTLDMTGVTQQGSCDIEMVDASGRQMGDRLYVDPPPSAAEIQIQQQQQAQLAAIKQMVGSEWSVHLPDGKTETWKASIPDPRLPYVDLDNGKGAKYKTIVQVYNGQGTVMVQLSPSCMLQGTLRGGKASGAAVGAPTCSYRLGSPWSADVK